MYLGDTFIHKFILSYQVMPCREISYRYKVRKFSRDTSRYANDKKRCNSCSVFIEWNEKHSLWCGLS